MAKSACRVELSASFLERLESIEAFLQEAGARHAFDAPLSALRSTVIPNLRRFARMGRRYLAQPPQSVEAIAQRGLLPVGAIDALRVLSTGDDLVLYPEEQLSAIAYLLSICHQRQLGFDFAKLWLGQHGENER